MHYLRKGSTIRRLRKGSTILRLHIARRSEVPSLAFALKRIAALRIYLLQQVRFPQAKFNCFCQVLQGPCQGARPLQRCKVLAKVQGPCKEQGPCKALCRNARPLQGRCKCAGPLQGYKALVRPHGFYPDARPLQACMAPSKGARLLQGCEA